MLQTTYFQTKNTKAIAEHRPTIIEHEAVFKIIQIYFQRFCFAYHHEIIFCHIFLIHQLHVNIIIFSIIVLLQYLFKLKNNAINQINF